MKDPSTDLVLVINAGSSSLKYQLIDADTGDTRASGLVERIGQQPGEAGEPRNADGTLDNASHTGPDGRHRRQVTCVDHRAAFGVLMEAFQEHGPDLAELTLAAVGHRVVHGGDHFSAPTLVTDQVIAAITALIPLAPLHNLAHLQGIRGATERFPDTPQVVVFDTAFHQTLPPHAYTYAIPRTWREDHGVRRYGFHGTSYTYVSRRTAELLGRPLRDLNLVVLHLGNGASAAAVAGGRSIDTSMGLAPLEGLVMGTRSGDLDASVPAHLARAGISVTDFDRGVTTQSGLLGLTGDSDFREVSRRAAAGDPEARLGLEVTAYRIRKYIGAYAAALGHVDAIVFTAGVGEHSPDLRLAALRDLPGLGGRSLELDEVANAAATSGEHRISTDASEVVVLVVPTNEELEIARQSAALIRAGTPGT
ncbi:MAG: acetate kinase [Lapillicoccus sp.]